MPGQWFRCLGVEAAKGGRGGQKKRKDELGFLYY